MRRGMSGPAAEANSLQRGALGQGVLTLTVVNFAATVIAVGGSYVRMELLKSTGPSYDR